MAGIPAFESIPDAQGNLNFKMYTDAAAAVPLQMSQNAATGQHRLNILGENLLAMVGKTLHSVDVVEAVSSKQMLTGHAGMDASAMIAAGQLMMKGAQTTPPATAPAPVVPMNPNQS